MKLFELFKKPGEKEAVREVGEKSDMRELEIYSGMRVVVETPDGRLLFIARLHETERSSGIPTQGIYRERMPSM